MTESRTAKSIRNSVVALIFFVIQFILSFYSRKVFLNYLGEDILGLNTTATNILQFLNIAELGISNAVAFSLYNPLHNNHTKTINEIVTLQGYLYRRIAVLIIIGAIIVMLFFPLIFKKITLPLWYAYASFSVLLFSALLGYFINYRQIVLTASQKDYKIQYSVGVCNIFKVISQIIALSNFTHPYIWWLIIEVIFTILSCIVLQIMIHKSFPLLKDVKDSYKTLTTQYAVLIKKTKQVFFHKIGAFTLSQSSPLIIYAYSSLSLVALYGNYVLISNGIMRLINAVFNSMGAGIGDLIAEGNREKIISIFYELYSIRFYISAVLAFCLITLGQQFIKVWIGQEYLLALSTLIIISFTLFIRLNRYTVDQFIAGKGLYQDIWSPIIEACLNIGLSILLGFYFGLNGILSGVLISLICVIELWKPYFLFRFGFQEPINNYFKNYLLHLSIASIVGYVIFQIYKYFWLSIITNWIDFILVSIIVFLSYSLILGLLLYFFSSGYRCFIKRISCKIKSKLQ